MATYSKKQLSDAIRDHCYECNDCYKNWDDPKNDCTGKSCVLYPFRPGNGPGHATKKLSKATHSGGFRKKSADISQKE